MDTFESKNITSPIKSKEVSEIELTQTNDVKLDDFFEFLDKKTIENIKNTPLESKVRISQNITDIENDINITKEILKSL